MTFQRDATVTLKHGLRPGQSATISARAHRYLGATWHLTAYGAVQ